MSSTTYDRNLCFVLEPSTNIRDLDSLPENPSHEKNAKAEQKYEAVTRMNNVLYNHVIEPAVEGRGFRIVRSSEISTQNMMTREHENRIDEAGIVIANLTGADPIIYYCLARLMARIDEREDQKDSSCPQFVIALREADEANLFDLPGPLANPIKYTAERSTFTASVSALTERENEAIVGARRDLMRAVRRADLALRPQVHSGGATGGTTAAGGNPGNNPGGNDGGASGSGSNGPKDGGPSDGGSPDGGLADGFLSRFIKEEIRRATRGNEMGAFRDHFLNRR